MVAAASIIIALLGTLFFVLVALFIFFKYNVFTFWKKKGVIYDEPTFLVGNIGPMVMGTRSIGEILKKSYDKLKKHRFYGTYMFYKPNLVIADPNLIRFVLTQEFASFHDRGMYCNEKIDPTSGHLFLLSGKRWRNLRVKLTPTFTSGKIKNMFEVFKESGDRLIKYLDMKMQQTAEIEMKDVIARYAIDNIMSMAFGIDSDSINNPNCEFRYWGKKIVESRPIRHSLAIFAPKILDWFSIPLTEVNITKFFVKVFRDTVEYRQNNEVVRHDFLELIMQLMKNGYVDSDDRQNNGSENTKQVEKLTMLEGAAQAYIFFLAGFETSSSIASFCLYELALNQDIQRKVRKEIEEKLKEHGGLTYEAVMDMPYLHKVVSETMRKYPTLPIINRVCTNEVELPSTGVVIPVGTLITVPIFAIHHDPFIYADPEKFDPERFSAENIAARHPFAYLPFGEGPRICIGMRFGYIQIKIALISTLLKFSFRPGPKTKKTIEFDPGLLVLAAKDGINLIVEPR